MESFSKVFSESDESPYSRAAKYAKECSHRIQSIDQELTLAGTK